MYDIWIYATTKLIAETPIMILVSLLDIIMLYWSIGFTDTAENVLIFWALLFMVIQASSAIGYSISAAFNDEITAAAFAPVVNLPLSALGGYMVNL